MSINGTCYTELLNEQCIGGHVGVNMPSRKVHIALCVVYCCRLGICTAIATQFVNVDFLEGNIFLETLQFSLFDCVAACAQRTTLCRGSRYNLASNECQLIDKWSSALTTMFYSNSEWKIFMQVLHSIPGKIMRTHLINYGISLLFTQREDSIITYIVSLISITCQLVFAALRRNKGFSRFVQTNGLCYTTHVTDLTEFRCHSPRHIHTVGARMVALPWCQALMK